MLVFQIEDNLDSGRKEQRESIMRKIELGTLFCSRCASLLAVSGLWLLFVSGAAAQTWNQVWSDEFAGPLGTPIDTAKWTFETGILNVNNEVEYYCAPRTVVGGCNATKPNAYIDGSDHLVIQAIRLNPSTVPNSGSWTSARMTTNGTQQFQYGRAEAKMMLPVGPGIWPAFWALGTNISSVGWPMCGEIDYMENVPATGGLGPMKISSTLHGSGYSADKGLSQKYTLTNSDVTGWHTYGAIWSPNMMQFYVDDPTKIFFIVTTSDVPAGQSWAFNHPFFLLMNLAVGGDGSWPGAPNATTPTTAVMTVDYVRIYQAATVPAPSLGNPTSISVKAGATSGNTSTMSVANTRGTGRVFLSCTTTAPRSACQVTTNDALNSHTLDFSATTTGTAVVTASTTSNAWIPPTSFRWRARQEWPLSRLILALYVALLLARLRSRILRPASAWASSLLVFGAILLGCGGGNSSAQPPPDRGTPPGTYSLTVNAYSLSGDGTAPDATVNIPLTVN
jgi:beta-glucanase (GH16 family)